jgi:hypothetical protein
VVRDELATRGGVLAPVVSGKLHAPDSAATTRTSASLPGDEASRGISITDPEIKAFKPTPLCASGYVSGTILHLKQGTDPHPQGIARKGHGYGGWLHVRFVLFSRIGGIAGL